MNSLLMNELFLAESRRIARHFNPSGKDQDSEPPDHTAMKTCKFCRRQVTSSHYCPETHRTIPYDDDGSSFLTSMAYGMAFHNGLIGGAIGGNMAGGMVGEMLSPPSTPDYSSPAPDYSPPPDTSSSSGSDSGYSGTDTSSSGSGGDF